jgi:hypothetical protein
MAVEDTLEERGTRYGNYLKQTEISNDLRTRMMNTPGWETMEVDMEDALTMISVKISRILNGDPFYSDNWQDIAGYATLVADRLDGNERK